MKHFLAATLVFLATASVSLAERRYPLDTDPLWSVKNGEITFLEEILIPAAAERGDGIRVVPLRESASANISCQLSVTFPATDHAYGVIPAQTKFKVQSIVETPQSSNVTIHLQAARSVSIYCWATAEIVADIWIRSFVESMKTTLAFDYETAPAVVIH